MIHDKKFLELQKIYKKMEEDIRGEYWIDSSGSVIGADIDVNDVGHEGVVKERLMHEYTNIFDIDFERHPKEDMSGYVNEIKQFLVEEGIIVTVDDSNTYDEDPSAFAWERYLVNLKSIKDEKDRALDALGIIWDLPGNMKDARDYAMKYFGDKRVAGHNIQTWTLTSNDLRIIGNGLWEINGDDIPEEEEFNIEVMNPQARMMFWSVPWSVLSSDDPGQLMSYKER